MKPFYFVLQNPKFKENQNFINYTRDQLVDEKSNFIFYADQQKAKQSAKPPYIFATLMVDKNLIAGGKEVKELEKFSSHDTGNFHSLVKNNKLLLANASIIVNDHAHQNFLFTANRIQENPVFNHRIINLPEQTNKKDDEGKQKDTPTTESNFINIDINQLETYQGSQTGTSLTNKLEEGNKLLEKIIGIVNDDGDNKPNEIIENNNSSSDWVLIDEDKKSNHFYIKLKLATSKIFTFFKKELEKNYIDIIGSLIFKELNKKSIKIHIDTDKKQENDTAYLSCSTVEEPISDYTTELSKVKEKITIDKMDFRFHYANENKDRSLRFKHNKNAKSLFFPPENKFTSFCGDEYNDDKVGSSGKRFYICNIFNRSDVKDVYTRKNIINHVISNAKNLNQNKSSHVFIEHNPLSTDKQPLNYDKNTQFYAEIRFSENDVINGELREDYTVEQIVIYDAMENSFISNTDNKIIIKEAEIYPELEITPHDLRLTK